MIFMYDLDLCAMQIHLREGQGFQRLSYIHMNGRTDRETETDSIETITTPLRKV